MASNHQHQPTAADALAFALDFAHGEPTADWNDGLAAFLGPGETVAERAGVMVSGFDDKLPLSYTDMKRLQHNLRELFRGLIGSRDQSTGFSGFHLTITVFPFDMSSVASSRRRRHPVVLMVRGDVRNLVLYQTMRLLEQLGTDRILACPARRAGAVCGRLFVKQTRKEFCSKACQAREWIRGERERQRQRDEERKVRRGKQTRKR